MIRIPLVDDYIYWHEVIQGLFGPHGIQVDYFENGDEFILAIQNDDADQYKAALIDWRLPGLSGPEIARRVRLLKPYLKLFAFTEEDDKNKIARVTLSYPFDGFLSKDSINDEAELLDFIGQIKQAVSEVEEIIICQPFSNKSEHRAAYLTLRNSATWSSIDSTIEETAERLILGEYSKKRTLRDALPTRSRHSTLINNILIARRIIMALILEEEGVLHTVEQIVGYEEEPVEGEESEDEVDHPDDYKMWDSGFKNYCSELSIKPHEFMNKGEGMLPEEARWLKKYCEQKSITFAFPVVKTERSTGKNSTKHTKGRNSRLTS